MPEDAVPVEWNTPRGRQVRGKARARRYPVVHRDDTCMAPLEPAEGDRKRVAQSRNHLKKGQICVAARLAEQISAARAPQYPIEIVEIFRQAKREEIGRPALRLRPLFLVVEAGSDRVVRIVHLDQPVGDGELELVHPEAASFVLRREAQARPEELQDVRGLRDDLVSGNEIGRSERGSL